MKKAADLKVQFQLSDLIAALMIIGWFPLIMEACFSNFDKEMRLVSLAIGIILECGAILWGFAIVNTWKINAFFSRMAIQFYAFLATLGFVVLIGQTVFVVFLVPGRLHRFSEQAIAQFFLTALVSSALSYSMYVVERKRIARIKQEETNAEINPP